MDQWKVVAAGAALSLSVAAIVLLANDATADRVVVISAAKARFHHASVDRNPDGGFGATFCGETERTDGGLVPVDEPCIRCDAPSWGQLDNACLNVWKARNTDP